MSPAYLAVLLGAMLWGTTGTAQAFAPATANPLTIGAVRIAIGGMVLLAVSFFRGNLKLDKSWPMLPTFIGALGIAAYQPFFFTAVQKTGVAIGTVVAIGSSPIMAGILSWVIRKEKPEKKWYLATVIAITGCTMLFAPDSGQSASLIGVIFALGAGLSYALYATVSKQLLDKYPSDLVVAIIFSLSAIFLAPILFIHKPIWLLETSGLLVALHLGVFTAALSYLLFSSGLAKMPVSTAVTLTLAEPLTAAFLGIFLVGEKLVLSSLLGIGLLFIGLVVLSREGKANKDLVTDSL